MCIRPCLRPLDATQVGEAMFLSAVIGMLGCLFMTFNADLALRAVGVMPGSDVAMHAAPYIKWGPFHPSAACCHAHAAMSSAPPPVALSRCPRYARVLPTVCAAVFQAQHSLKASLLFATGLPCAGA